MAHTPEQPEILVVEEQFVLDQGDLTRLYDFVRGSLPMLISAKDGDIGPDGSMMGGGDRTVQEETIVRSVETRFFPFSRPEASDAWRHIGSLIERVNIGHELGEQLACLEYRLLWDGGNMFDLVGGRYSKAVAKPQDLNRLLGYFGVEEQPQAA